ncbi:hypothetical protein [Algoriphagus zhangzhouensis]|uniref:Uncharacterized protein n=1 Tax=Algoriphagus zhangzhouensis TaxID=1073327 RepID=A0A1M7Z4X4_9BACT|nr:hypothetical protein [Algoriphagus zhangzhouensis]TDY48766.1 hypothetical protein A8938_0452 [Algoriphagus zhangzhouensis]SHO59921.1 hypothetical protein SAMN04488108_0452 [Algoriphagus zhangzhouensis]
MIIEKHKNEIHQLIDQIFLLLGEKRNELEEKRIKGEDSISAFMVDGEVPEIFCDPQLNSRNLHLLSKEQELIQLQQSAIEDMLKGDINGIQLTQVLKPILKEFELAIKNI